MYGCVLMNGKERTVNAKVVCLADTVDEAIAKSDKLLETKNIWTIVKKI